MRLLHKFTVLLSILVIMSSLIQFLIFDKIFLANTDSLLLDINRKAADNVGEQLSAYFNKIQTSLKTIASNSKIRNNQEVLDKISVISSEINVISILDEQGNLLLVSGAKEIPKLNLSQRDYFQAAMKGQTYITNVYTSISGRQVVSIATPIIENGNISGVVVGTIQLRENNLASIFDNKSFGRGGFIGIIDRQGMIVYHPDKKRIGSKTEIFDSLQENSGSTIRKTSYGKENYIGYNRVPELGWLITVSTPTSELTQLRSIMLYQSLMVLIILIILLVAVGTYTIRRYTEPIDKLIRAFGLIKKGTYKEISAGEYAIEFNEIIEVYNDTIRNLEEVHTMLTRASELDGLTGAYNRRAFDKVVLLLDGQIQARSLETLTIMLLDLDHFKQVNDLQGHLAGDDVLRNFTEIAQSVAGARAVFRFGGDEYTIILRNVAPRKLLSLAEEIRLQCERNLNGCTVSIGIATYPKNGDTVEELLDCADKALYISKESKNKITAYND